MPETADLPGIAFVVAGLGAGGAERVIAILARGFVGAGRRVTVIAFDAEDDPVYHDFGTQVRLLRLGTRQTGAGGTFGRVRRLRAVLRREGFGVVISFLTKINVITLLASIGLDVPVIASERNNPLRQPGHPLWRMALQRLYPRAAAIVLQTEASRVCLPPAVASAAMVIANPLAASDAGRAGPLPADSRRLLTAVGRFENQKGFDLLLPAFAIVAQTHPEWRLAIWGEGPLRSAIESQVRALGLTDRVTLPGLSTTPGGWQGEAGAFVLSSRYEGFPNVLGEAMAAGLPVVSFDCPFGPSEMIDNDFNGLLVPDGDVPALAAALDRLLGDAALRSRLGAAARQSAAAFAPGVIFERWQALETGVRSAGRHGHQA